MTTSIAVGRSSLIFRARLSRSPSSFSGRTNVAFGQSNLHQTIDLLYVERPVQCVHICETSHDKKDPSKKKQFARSESLSAFKMHRQCSTLLSSYRLTLIKQHTLHHQLHRSITFTPSLHATKKRRPIDESSWANAQHKPSLGNASFDHLISELSSTKEGMEHLRVEGQTMSEEHRAEARGVVKWLIAVGAVVVGVPVGLGVKRMVWDEGGEAR